MSGVSGVGRHVWVVCGRRMGCNAISTDFDVFSLTLKSDGTFVEVEDGEEATGIWSLEGDQLTISDSDGSDSDTLTLNSVTDTEMTLIFKDEDGEETVTYTRRT